MSGADNANAASLTTIAGATSFDGVAKLSANGETRAATPPKSLIAGPPRLILPTFAGV